MSRTYQLGPARRALNSVVTLMLRLGVGGRSSRLLTSVGRRTGRPRTTPVSLVETDGQQWLVSPYGQVNWVHNVRAHPEVSLRRGRTSTVVQAHEVGPEIAGPVLRRYVHDVTVTAPFFDAAAGDPVQSFVEEAHRHPVFRLTHA